MKYNGTAQFDHGQAPRIGVLLTNLGTPEAPQKGPLKTYLRQFLSDPRVVEVPRLLWYLILNGIILNIRPARSAAAYRRIWTEQGSPLLVHTQAQAMELQANLHEKLGETVVVDFAMRYGEPALDTKIETLLKQGIRRLLVLPLYPQYSGATTASTFDAIAADFTRRRWLPELRFVAQYHDHPAYIEALARSIRGHWEQHGQADKLIFSYHGEPQRYLDQGDPYHCQCHKTSRLLAQALELDDSQYQTCFQSRFGREPWLQPYTDKVLEALPGSGIKSVQVICPGFAADCLETLEEIDMENRDLFLAAGGERFEYIPCLNAAPDHIEALGTLILENLQGWLPLASDPAATRALATKLGAEQ